MDTAKKLDLAGSTLVLLSAFAELFILSGFTANQSTSYIIGIMENQAWLADMLKDIALGVDTGDLDQLSFSEARSQIQLFSETYSWEAELFGARLIVGVSFIVGTIMVIAGKAMAK